MVAKHSAAASLATWHWLAPLLEETTLSMVMTMTNRMMRSLELTLMKKKSTKRARPRSTSLQFRLRIIWAASGKMNTLFFHFSTAALILLTRKRTHTQLVCPCSSLPRLLSPQRALDLKVKVMVPLVVITKHFCTRTQPCLPKFCRQTSICLRLFWRIKTMDRLKPLQLPLLQPIQLKSGSCFRILSTFLWMLLWLKRHQKNNSKASVSC